MEQQTVQMAQVMTWIDVLTIIISILALASSIIVGYKQVKISQLQADMQDKVELYLLAEPVIFKDAGGQTPDRKVPAVFIRNLGNNVIYLENYKYNGKEYPLGKEVIPPVSSFNGFHYIFLPTDGTTHVSIEIDFRDWKDRAWRTKGFADYKDGTWEITYSPCEQRS